MYCRHGGGRLSTIKVPPQKYKNQKNRGEKIRLRVHELRLLVIYGIFFKMYISLVLFLRNISTELKYVLQITPPYHTDVYSIYLR